jgi:hypothetical protein
MPPLPSPSLCTPNSASASDKLIVPCLTGSRTLPTTPILNARHRLLASRSRWAGYLQSLPSRQNWDAIALFWDAALCDPLSSRDTDTDIDTDTNTDTNDDGRRTESGSLDPDGDAVEARRWLRVTEAETHFLLPGPHRRPLLVSPFAASASDERIRVEDDDDSARSPPLSPRDMYHRKRFPVSTSPLRRPGLSMLDYPHLRWDFGMPTH